MKTIIAFLVLAVNLAVAEGNKEFHPFLTTGVDVLNNLGYKNPILSIGGGAEFTTTHLFLETRIYGALTPKIETGDGRSFNFESTAMTRKGHFLFGGTRRRDARPLRRTAVGPSRPRAEFDRLGAGGGRLGGGAVVEKPPEHARVLNT